MSLKELLSQKLKEKAPELLKETEQYQKEVVLRKGMWETLRDIRDVIHRWDNIPEVGTDNYSDLMTRENRLLDIAMQLEQSPLLDEIVKKMNMHERKQLMLHFVTYQTLLRTSTFGEEKLFSDEFVMKLTQKFFLS